MKKIKRNALNRGSAVYVAGSRVRFLWPCGCTKVETIKSPAGEIAPEMVSRMVNSWRNSGVTLEQCPRHPAWHSKVSQVSRLNSEYPQGASIV